MYKRIQLLDVNNSFFLFGPRGSGKSTLLQSKFQNANAYWIDFLDAKTESEYSKNPGLLLERWQRLSPKPDWVVIDEVQKVPAILDTVHLGIERYNIRFALTGSSARKLMRGAANMLAGRAFVFHLHPLTHIEIGAGFDLHEALAWGTLPGVFKHTRITDKKRFLQAYAHTYLKEEIQLEQIVRNMTPFRRFIEIAAQCSGDIVNFSKIGREAGVDYKSVERYYEVLKDTLAAFYLEPYHHSVRKQQTQKPKIYIFDTGVLRALQNNLDIPITESTYTYGKLFENFVVSECFRINDYLEKNYRFYYLRSKDGAEIDLIVDRPGKTPVLVEIKSKEKIFQEDLSALKNYRKDFPGSPCFILSKEKTERIVEDVIIFPWQAGIRQIFAAS